MTRIVHDPVDRAFPPLAGDGVYLRIWSPRLVALDANAPLAAAIQKMPQYSTSPAPRRFTLDQPLALPAVSAHERVYALPPSMNLEPLTEYGISGWIQGQTKAGQLFAFSFHTDQNGQPAAY